MIAAPVRTQYGGFPIESDQPTAYTPCTSPNNQSLCLPPTVSPRIVIPPRRPGSKERGCILAYPPVLDTYGISQPAFLQFLQGCNKAVQGHAALTAVGAVGFGVGVAPEPISMLVGAAVQFGASALNKNVATWKTNSYIDKCNKEIFFPRGLMCIISIHDPEAAAMGMNQTMASNQMGTFASLPFGESYGTDSRVTRSRGNGLNAMEEVAPLVYHADPETTSSQEAGAADKAKMSHRVKNVYANINHYLDKRSRATYAREYPNDILASIQPPAECTARSTFFDRPRPYHQNRSMKYQGDGNDRDQRGEPERKIKKDILFLTIIQAPDHSQF